MARSWLVLDENCSMKKGEHILSVCSFQIYTLLYRKLETEKAMQHYNNIASKSSQAYINVRFSKGEVVRVGS